MQNYRIGAITAMLQSDFVQSWLGFTVEMSQIKKQPKDKECSKQSAEHSCFPRSSDSCLHLIAWLLLIVGLCILGTIFYLALRPHSNDNNILSTPDTGFQLFDSNEEKGEEGDFDFTIASRAAAIIDLTPTHEGCMEMSCRLLCSNNEDIYADTAAAMNASHCGVATTLMITNLQKHCIEDKWIDMDFPVLKIVLNKCDLTVIKSGAFNSAMFAKVWHMSWKDLNLKRVSSGALLGLYSLRKLEIETKLQDLSLTFLQPVQTTLTHLRLNAAVSFDSNSSLFDNINFDKVFHLDLSYNTFKGPISKRMFSATPNVTYLYLRNCMITAIEDDAFEILGDKLLVLSLSRNLLTTISANVLSPCVGVESRTLFDMDPNTWLCDCQLQPLIDLYATNRNQFMKPLYCRMPYRLYGINFDELDSMCETSQQPIYTLTAKPTSTVTESYTTNAKPDELVIKTTATQTTAAVQTIIDEDVELSTNENILSKVLRVTCLEAIDAFNIKSCDDEFDKVKRDIGNENLTRTNIDSGIFVFQSPPYDLHLELAQNHSVLAWIENYDTADQLNIIWFTELFENDVISEDTSQLDYNCMQYEDPYLAIDPLQPNYTYTFCMMPKDEVVISPLYCQPLHVPITRTINDNDDIWIAENEKQFTIAMLCLIFAMSAFFGALIAYLGIKTYPDLLEGSKNVLVVKESDRTCYVSTITESEYMKSTLKKQPLHGSSFRNENLKPLPETPEASANISTIELSRLASVKSSSTCFDDSFTNAGFQGDEYEMPKQFKYSISENCEPNKYTSSPGSPPPLPKRNSTTSLINNRTSAINKDGF